MKRRLTSIKSIIFDLDNTLYNEEDYIENALMNVATTFCNYRNLNKQDVFNFLKKDRIENGEKELFQRLLDRYKVVKNKENIEQLVLAYRNCKCNLVPYPDADYTLSTLKNKGFKLGIITNGGEKTQKNKLNLLGINKYFDAIVITGEWFPQNLWKPNKEPFYLCFQKLGVKANECIYVGDNFNKDIKGAFNVGALPVLIDRNEKKYKYSFKCYKDIEYLVINSLKQIIDICYKGVC